MLTLFHYSILFSNFQKLSFFVEINLSHQLLSTLPSVREVWGSIPGPVKSGTVSPTARYRCDVPLDLCCPGAMRRRWPPPLVSPYMLRRNIASIMKILFDFAQEKLFCFSFFLEIRYRYFEIPIHLATQLIEKIGSSSRSKPWTALNYLIYLSRNYRISISLQPEVGVLQNSLNYSIPINRLENPYNFYHYTQPEMRHNQNPQYSTDESSSE